MAKNAASKEASRARAEEAARQERIRAGTQSINDTFGQFNDGFFSNLSDSYVNFARPELDKQFGDAREQLTYALSRNGLLDSSVRAEREGDLTGDYNTALQDITDKGRGYAKDARNQTEQARGDLVSMLQVTGDNQGAANAALSRAQILSTPPSYSPLGQLFTDFTSGLATQAAFERAEALSGAPRGSIARFNTGLFSPRSGSVKVS